MSQRPDPAFNPVLDAPTRARRYHPRTVFWIVLVVGAGCLLPILVTPILPLIDFYAHVARYFVLGHLHSDPWLAENYAASWTLLPNLGLDLIGTLVLSVLPPLEAARLLASFVVLSLFGGTLMLAHALHGEIRPLNVILAGLLPYSFILTWGFVNFLFGLGLMLGALGLWIRQEAHPGWQLATALVLGSAIMMVHALAFGLFGLMLFCVEVMRMRVQVSRPVTVHALAALVGRLARLMLVALPPMLIFLLSKTAEAEQGITAAFSNLAAHAESGQLGARLREEALRRVDSFLRVSESAYPWLDRMLGLFLWGSGALAFRLGALHLDQQLHLAVGLTIILVFVMPPNLFGVGYVNERMPLLLLALLAGGTSLSPHIWWGAPKSVSALHALFTGLLVANIGLVTLAYAREAESYRHFLRATHQLPPGGLAETIYFGDMRARDPGRSCKPLLFVLLLRNGTAVSTFANPTQQPLRLAGPLQDARLVSRGLTRSDGSADRAAIFDTLISAGYDTVLFCDTAPLSAELYSHLQASGPGWRLLAAP